MMKNLAAPVRFGAAVRFGARMRLGAEIIFLLIAGFACGSRIEAQSSLTYVLTVESSDPASGAIIAVAPADTKGASKGTTKFTRTYDAGATVTLTAPAKAGSNDFVEWTGCKTAATVTCKVVMSAGKTVIAKYSPAYTLTVASSDPASGVAIGVSPADRNRAAKGTTKFTRSYFAGTDVTLTAPAKSGSSVFVSWTGCKTASTVTCKVLLDANTTVTAKYSPTYVLTVDSSNPQSGVAIAVSPADRSGAAKGTTKFTRTYLSGTAVTLTAPSKSGDNTFAGWSGCTTESTVTCKVTIKSGVIVTAKFSIPGKIAPAVAVTPSSKNILTTQALAVVTAVTGPGSKPTPTGTVKLAGGGYSSAAATLVSGRATIDIPAASLTAGADTLTATYTPDTAGSATYESAFRSTTVTVTAPPPVYTLTIDSAHPSSGIPVTTFPADNSNMNYGATPFTLKFNAGTTVKLTATTPSGGFSYLSWSGCASSTNTGVCNVQVNGNTTVTANYNQPNVTAVKISPTPAVATIGVPLQLSATVLGTGAISQGVTWSLTGAGTLSPSGLYTTPYPAPASVSVTATSTQAPGISGSIVVTLSPPAAATGPALSVDTNTPNTPSENPHAISPLVYGMNGYFLDHASATIAHPGVIRWGGDDISRYNYQNGMTNSASDYYFENFLGAGNMFGGGSFDGFIAANNGIGAATLGTVPVLGWVANGTEFACSFIQSQFPSQQSYNGTCGNGTDNSGAELYGNNTIAAITSTSEPAPSILSAPAPGSVTSEWADGTWPGGWVNSVVNSYGAGNPASGAGQGVAIWDLDNEPTWWDAVHRDVHPNPFTYDEVTNNGIGTALAIKTADPTAMVSGPVIDNWWAYFYSKEDMEDGWGSGPCYQPWDNPVDRQAHSGIPLIEYFMQKFNTYSKSYGIRLLDYVDIHGYFAPNYNNGSVAFTTAGDTGEQQARMNGTRVFWDPAYTDPNFPQPNYITDSGYTTSCNVPAQAPQLINRLQTWVANDYPGTRTSIDEYNFGGLESINGAVVQADILGIFGRQGLDMSALWPTNAYNAQGPGNYAFAMFRNYDGNNSTFGDTYLFSTSQLSSADAESKLAVYGALRSSDGAITVMVVNKTYGALTSTLSLQNLTVASGATAQVFQYSNANLNAIASLPALAVTPPASAGTVSTIAATFPGQSITLLVIPAQ
jgi:hypothetical protein